MASTENLYDHLSSRLKLADVAPSHRRAGSVLRAVQTEI